MADTAPILISIGGVLLLGLLTDAMGRRTPLPRVTLLLVFGLLVGPAGFRILPEPFIQSFDLLANMALVMVGFLLGGKFTLSTVREHGREILSISSATVLITALFVFAALLPTDISLALALILAGIAPATAPAATADVVSEAGADGPFCSTLLGVVALDDAWGLVLFSLCLAAAAATLGLADANGVIMTAAWEICGAVLLGLVVGLPAAYLTGRIEPGEPTLAEAVGLVFLCGGLAIYLDVSFLIASIVLGAVVANLAPHHNRPFHAIEKIDWPFMVLFFVLAGASLEVTDASRMAPLVAIYVAARGAGRIVGGWLGGVWGRSQPLVRTWIGTALMPQAGVALGMALVASSRLPQFKETLLPVVIGSTIIFEIAGPIATRYALRRVGEAAVAQPHHGS